MLLALNNTVLASNTLLQGPHNHDQMWLHAPSYNLITVACLCHILSYSIHIEWYLLQLPYSQKVHVWQSAA